MHPLEFAEALVEKVGGLESLNPSLTGEEADKEPQPRAPDGKFASPNPPEGVEEDSAEEEVPEEDGIEPVAEQQDGEEELEYELDLEDPKVQAYLEKYDGDLNKALAAATDASSLIGQQGNEMGQMRQQLTEMQQYLQWQHQQAQQAAAQPQPSNLPPVNWGELIDDNPAAAAKEALSRWDDRALVAAVEAWKEEEPYEAAVFVMGLANELTRLELEEQNQARFVQAQQQAALQHQQRAAFEDLGKQVGRVIEKYPDLPEALPAIAEVAEERPMLRAALERGNPAQVAGALEDLYIIASSRQVADTSGDAMRKVAQATQREAQEAKAKAAVVSASRRKSAGEQVSNVDQFRSAFRQHMGLQEDE